MRTSVAGPRRCPTGQSRTDEADPRTIQLLRETDRSVMEDGIDLSRISVAAHTHR